MHNTLVTVAQSPNPNDLLVLKAKLESHGIWCYLADQHTSSNLGYAATAIGGTKLTIRASDAEKAIEVLNEFNLIPDANLAYQTDQQFFKRDDEFVAFIKNPKNKDKWINLARFSKEEDLITATNILTENGIDCLPKSVSKKMSDDTEEFSVAVKLGDISQAVEVLAIRMESDVYFEPAADEYFETLFNHQAYELPDDPDEKNHELTEKQIDDRNNRLKRNAILFLFYAFALIFLYAIFEDLIREYLKRF
jgi:hypothetical protein